MNIQLCISNAGVDITFYDAPSFSTDTTDFYKDLLMQWIFYDKSLR